MGQFKPMVKMMTTEPTVELKLKKGGHVNMKKGGKAEAGHKKMAMGGGALDMMSGTPALVGRPAVNAPVRSPGKPSMASRRKAMMAKKPAVTPSGPPMPMPPMKKGGKAEGGESKKTHMAEMSKMKGLEKELKSHESKPASKGHKGLKTGGVANGQGGYKKGGDVKMAKGGVAGNGIINTEKQGGAYRDTMMHTAKPDHSPAKTGGVKNGNGGGYKTGGVTKSNAGGYKMGGSTKKAYAAGGTVNSGKPVAMPQGAKKPSSPVSINQLSGTFKKGGKVTPAQSRLMKNFASENKTAMKQAKAQSNEVYSKYGNMKMAGGGSVSDAEEKFLQELQKTKESNDLLYRYPEGTSMDDVLSGKGSRNKSLPLAKGDERTYNDLLYRFPKGAKMPKGIEGALKGMGSVTETEKSITVSPAGKKRGGRAC